MTESFPIEIRPTSFDPKRAASEFLPLLECCYLFTRDQPYRLPEGYQLLSLLVADAIGLQAIALGETHPEAQGDARAMVVAAAHPDRFGIAVRHRSSGAILVGFRGTLVPSEWLRSLAAFPEHYRMVPDFGTVHLGFHALYNCIRTSLFEALHAVSRSVPVTLIGHNLGGALATLAAPDIGRNLPLDSLSVCTFGAPRVGFGDFRAAFDRSIHCCHRVANQFDIAPHLPTIAMGWRHVGEALELDGNVDEAHSLTAYLTGLGALQSPSLGVGAASSEPSAVVVP
jgi:triacylglycerol lipase